MVQALRHLHRRELAFLGLIGLTALLIALHLIGSQHLAGTQGSGWRNLDVRALERRIEAGELRDREADWYSPGSVNRSAPGPGP